MRIAVLSARAYDPRFLDEANAAHRHELTYLDARLEEVTAPLAEGFDAVCPFVNDRVDGATIALCRTTPGVMIVNSSRGALIDTPAVIDALKDGRIGHLALDVYEEEGDLFFEDLSDQVIQDDVFSRLLTFPNMLITAHQAFFTQEALRNIAEATLGNATAFAAGRPSGNEIEPAQARAS